MISIVNYGLGNLGSIQNMFKKLGFESKIINSPSELENSTKIILPGVGAFDTGMKHLREGGWIEYLNKKVLIEKVPALGICLGMQLMCNKSEEGALPGLGWVNADVKKFSFENSDLKIPHMGWNDVTEIKGSKLLTGFTQDKRFYFVHSYYVSANEEANILFKTKYGFEFTSAFEKDNLIGMQFHPEKSHKFGLSILKNFAENF
ncbi:imidazole glycerol phosphate synthase subunit HisH [Pedobacter sp. MW01-1-1]|uniref:imidazole glycerol phosphate synthase subunit HisH n=1 Tax=Pedobacter sp. MW01-1-1 TaxID=3383027 RepID=UPI003FEFBB5C